MMKTKKTPNAQRSTSNVEVRKRCTAIDWAVGTQGMDAAFTCEWAGSFAVCATQDDRSADFDVRRSAFSVRRSLLSQ
jgi:hypothetical protein